MKSLKKWLVVSSVCTSMVAMPSAGWSQWQWLRRDQASPTNPANPVEGAVNPLTKTVVENPFDTPAGNPSSPAVNPSRQSFPAQPPTPGYPHGQPSYRGGFAIPSASNPAAVIETPPTDEDGFVSVKISSSRSSQETVASASQSKPSPFTQVSETHEPQQVTVSKPEQPTRRSPVMIPTGRTPQTQKALPKVQTPSEQQTPEPTKETTVASDQPYGIPVSYPRTSAPITQIAQTTSPPRTTPSVQQAKIGEVIPVDPYSGSPSPSAQPAQAPARTPTVSQPEPRQEQPANPRYDRYANWTPPATEARPSAPSMSQPVSQATAPISQPNQTSQQARYPTYPTTGPTRQPIQTSNLLNDEDRTIRPQMITTPGRITPPNRQPEQPATILPPTEVVAPAPKTETPQQPQGPEFIRGTGVLARVGSELILERDIFPQIDKVLAQYKGKVPDSELEKARKKRTEIMIIQSINRKMLYLHAKQEIPEENFPNVIDQVDKVFADNVSSMITGRGLNSLAELEDMLREEGTSLERERQSFRENMLAGEWQRKNVEIKELVVREELYQYYQQHKDDYHLEAKCRWEEIMVRFDRFSSKRAAYEKIVSIGNQLLAGQPFSELAKAESQGFNAKDGGQYSWTTKGSLVNEKVDEVIFTLPVKKLSTIIESKEGLHIVRVHERQEEGYTPFSEMQREIKERILEQRREVAREKYADKLRHLAPVWVHPDYLTDMIKDRFSAQPLLYADGHKIEAQTIEK
ncbi:Hypothetical protein PBC10988_39960 [Planctomycetales bacterium 10988]|nr:Hypothetical protein PBC10988_39960 [Planctomycetales bacterium 10988]